MIDIPRTIRLSRKDISNNAEFQSELTNNIVSSNKELAYKLTQNQDWNTAKTIAGIENVEYEVNKYQIEAAERITRSIASNTDRDIVNRNYNTDKNMENRDYNTDRIINSLDELKGAFDWKLSELIWIQEKQTGYLQKILKTLILPRLTKANELREDGLRKYNNGWIDEAIDDFNQAIKENNTDFIVYQSLGNIYLFQKKDPETALQCFKNAAKYAIEFPYYRSYALLHAGLANYFLENYENAYAATKDATQISPNIIEAYYQNARYSSKLGKYDEAISNLRRAIVADRTYCAKILLEDDFESMFSQISYLFDELRVETQGKAENEINKAQDLISKYSSIDALETSKKRLAEAKELKIKGSYIDSKNALYKAYIAEKMALDSLIEQLSNREAKLKIDYESEKNVLEKLYEPFSEDKVGLMLGGSVGGVIGLGLFVYSWIPFAKEVIFNFSILRLLLLVGISIAILFMIIPALSLLERISDKAKYNKNKKISEDRIASISDEIDLNNKEISRIKSEMTNLNLDTLFMGFNGGNYENFLIKKFG